MAYMGFDKLRGELAHRKGVTNPGGLAAVIGRGKYGEKAFAAAGRAGRKLKGHKVRRKKHRRVRRGGHQ